MQEQQFVCPECGYTVNRNKHYLAIVEAQNFINLVMNNKPISDLCGKCNYFKYEELVDCNFTEINEERE